VIKQQLKEKEMKFIQYAGTRFLLAFLLSLSTFPLLSQDSTDAYTLRYPYLHPEFSYIQFYNRSAVDTFYKAWNETDHKKMSFVHLGDSHLQLDIYPGTMRKRLQEMHGDGGRGMMFAFSSAKTYSSVEYQTTHTGNWEYGKSYMVPSKIPLGVSGMTSTTADSNATLDFKFIYDVPSDYTVLKIFCKKDSLSYDLIVECGDQKIPVTVDSSATDTLPYYLVTLPPFKNEILLRLKRNHKYEKSFTFYGMSLETPTDKGVIYHNCGVGASMYKSILYQDLFSAQLPSLGPDVVIIDFGTNDFIYDDSIKANEETTITNVVRKVKAAAPNASIILTSTMDMYHKGDHVQSCEAFSDIIRRVAKAENCGFYDWYWVSGGWDMMPKYQQDEMGRPDGIHMTSKGYKLKGNLLSEAMRSTVEYMKANPKMDSLIIPLDSIKAEQHRIKLKADSDSVAVGPTVKVMHKIRKGESLSVIAKKYHVTVNQLRKWNHMQSNLIHTGKYLVVYCDPKYKPKPKSKPKPKPAGTTTSKPKPK
jgi:LysM repeat protein